MPVRCFATRLGQKDGDKGTGEEGEKRGNGRGEKPPLASLRMLPPIQDARFL